MRPARPVATDHSRYCLQLAHYLTTHHPPPSGREKLRQDENALVFAATCNAINVNLASMKGG